jgi:hypothetical protein
MLHLELISKGVRYIYEENRDGVKLPSCMIVVWRELDHVTW